MLPAALARRRAHPVERLVAYTAIAGPYAIRRPEVSPASDGIFQRPVMEAKRYKILPHLFHPTADITIWHDGNIWLRQPPRVIADRYLGAADLAVFAHPVRRTIWEEFQVLRTAEGRFNIPFLQRQLQAQQAAYRQEGLPAETPLYECNFLVRRRTDRVDRAMDAWWAQICRWQWRDQVSLPYVLWKYGAEIAVNVIHGPNIRHHPDFRYVPH